jgi:hypothetical protein
MCDNFIVYAVYTAGEIDDFQQGVIFPELFIIDKLRSFCLHQWVLN